MILGVFLKFLIIALMFIFCMATLISGLYIFEMKPLKKLSSAIVVLVMVVVMYGIYWLGDFLIGLL